MDTVPIQQQEVKTYRAVALCPFDYSELEYTGQALASAPMQYVHKCTICGKPFSLRKSYPTVEYG